MINVEYENLKKLNSIYLKELKETTDKVIESGWYILGSEVDTFERKFLKFLSSKYCIGVSNGMDALEMAFNVLDLPANSEVITSSHCVHVAMDLILIEYGKQCTPDLYPL